MHIIGHDHYVLNDILHQNEFRPDICMACYRYLSKEDQELRQAKKKNGELFVVSQTSDKNKHRHIEKAESLFVHSEFIRMTYLTAEGELEIDINGNEVPV